MISMTEGAARARRATGAMFFAVFGGLWIEGWASRSGAPAPAYVAIAVLALALLGVALFVYRRHAAALKAHPDTPQGRRARRVFHIVNAGQWIAIFVLANVLVNVGLGAWVVPMIVMVVGLHMFPLAHVFAYPAHYVTGAALCALALAYPGLAPAGPLDPAGMLGAGLILWASAAWAVKRL